MPAGRQEKAACSRLAIALGSLYFTNFPQLCGKCRSFAGALVSARGDLLSVSHERKGTDCAYIIRCEWIESVVHDSGCD
jgi:hypothetical protein